MTRVLILATALTTVAAGALAADLPYRRSAPPVLAVPPSFTWTGAYLGLQAAGVVGGDFKGATASPLPTVATQGNVGGFLVGGTAGYNYQLRPGDSFVVGIEGDLALAGFGNKTNIVGPGFGTGFLKTRSHGYFSTIRGRVGYAWGPLLVYVTGGGAFTEASLGAGFNAPGLLSSAVVSTKSLSGYVVGAGAEYAVTPNVSLKGEYLYSDFGRTSFAYPTIGSAVIPKINTELNVHQLKVGVNYKFDMMQ